MREGGRPLRITVGLQVFADESFTIAALKKRKKKRRWEAFCSSVTRQIKAGLANGRDIGKAIFKRKVR